MRRLIVSPCMHGSVPIQILIAIHTLLNLSEFCELWSPQHHEMCIISALVIVFFRSLYAALSCDTHCLSSELNDSQSFSLNSLSFMNISHAGFYIASISEFSAVLRLLCLSNRDARTHPGLHLIKICLLNIQLRIVSNCMMTSYAKHQIKIINGSSFIYCVI
jgi:hypothetical protein